MSLFNITVIELRTAVLGLLCHKIPNHAYVYFSCNIKVEPQNLRLYPSVGAATNECFDTRAASSAVFTRIVIGVELRRAAKYKNHIFMTEKVIQCKMATQESQGISRTVDKFTMDSFDT